MDEIVLQIAHCKSKEHKVISSQNGCQAVCSSVVFQHKKIKATILLYPSTSIHLHVIFHAQRLSEQIPIHLTASILK